MRILIINSIYKPIQIGGAEKSVALLAEALVRSGDKVAVVTLHPGSEESVEEVSGVRVYRIPLDNLYWGWGLAAKHNPFQRLLWHLRDSWNWKAAARIGRILDEEKPEVVHTNNIAGLSVLIWREIKKRKIRLVHTLRDYYLLCPRSSLISNGSTCENRCISCRLLTTTRKSLSTLPDMVVSNSKFVLNEHKRHGFFTDSAQGVIYNIADLEGASEAPEGGKDDGLLTFGFIGNINPEKGIEIVLEATVRLVHPNWRLRIAGSGLSSYIDDLKQRFQDPRIEWLGFAKSREFYRSIDVALISSVWAEPLPRTLIETFVAGKSAICAQSGGIPEIASLGKVVKLYPPRDVAALALLMDNALAHLELWKTGGFQDTAAQAAFSEPAVINRYHAAYLGEEFREGEEPLK